MGKQICDIKELSEYLDISVSEIRKLVREKRIPFFRIGNRLKFDVQRINLWLDEKHDMESSAKLFY